MNRLEPTGTVAMSKESAVVEPKNWKINIYLSIYN